MPHPSTRKMTSQSLQILRLLQGRPAMTVERIKHQIGNTTQTASARCSDLELFGLLIVEPAVLVRGNTATEVKAYRLSPSGVAVLTHSDPQSILHAASVVLSRMNMARARAFKQLKLDWRRDIADATQHAIQKKFFGLLDEGT